MTDVKALAGSVWGVPVRGAVVNLTSADVNSILSATSGLAKGLFLIGGGAIALALTATALFARLTPERDDLSWSTLAKVDTWDGWSLGLFPSRKFTRRFQGSCLTKEISISSDNHVFNVPIDYIKNYTTSTEIYGFIKKRTVVKLQLELFDDSRYAGIMLSPTVFEFLTPLGLQSIRSDSHHDIYGCTISDADTLKRNVDRFLRQEAQTLESLLGRDIFHRFFRRAS